MSIADFKPSLHGFPFVNWFPPGTPAIEVATPFGRIRIGDASAGLCGGMVFAAMDFHRHGASSLPASPEPHVFRYFVRRQIASWDLPFGAVKYYAWQRRAGASRFLGGIRVRSGLTRLTILNEWPRIRRELDAGRLAPLGLVRIHGSDPRHLVQNHQVLGYGYSFDSSSQEVTLRIYDPNYPGDDGTTLTFRLQDPDAEQRLIHSQEGPTVRGAFLTKYRKSKASQTIFSGVVGSS